MKPEITPVAQSTLQSVFQKITAYNHGRVQHLVARKYAALRENPFRFFRGTAHLFYDNWSLDVQNTPHVWVCGDAHIENFGSYKGNNRLVYFDINDFDEAALAPCTMDVARLLTSVYLASDVLKLSRKFSSTLVDTCITEYAKALQHGKAKHIEREIATGLVQSLLGNAQERRRKDFLNKRTTLKTSKAGKIDKEGKRRFILDDERYSAVNSNERSAVKAALEAFAANEERDLQDEYPRFFDVLDVAHRIAGTGSLGVNRFAVLVAGKGSPNDHYILDLKEAIPTALHNVLSKLSIMQPIWDNEAQRCTAIQRWMQDTSPALLHTLSADGTSYIVRELQPVQDKIDLTGDWDGTPRLLEEFVADAARLLAWAALRSSGWRGAAITDELIAFGADVQQWRTPLADYARTEVERVEADWKAFCDGHDERDDEHDDKPRNE
jgi:uncharacterized protein (DUF2252 family)